MRTIVVTLVFPSGGRVDAHIVSVPAVGDGLSVSGAHYRVESVEWKAEVVTPSSRVSSRIPLLRTPLGIDRPVATVRVVAAA